MAIEKLVIGLGGLAHSDDRRDLFALYNNFKIDNDKIFSTPQVKIAKIKDKEEIILGAHYHNYWEYFNMISGKAIFILEDINTKERREHELNETSGGILIPPKVAHKVIIEKNSILLGATEESYISPVHNDYPYKI